MAHIDRIEHVDKRINAVVLRRFDEALREADAADERIRQGDSVGPLHGVPVTVKDQYLVQSLPMTCGVSRLSANVAERPVQLQMLGFMQARLSLAKRTFHKRCVLLRSTMRSLAAPTIRGTSTERQGEAAVARRLL